MSPGKITECDVGLREPDVDTDREPVSGSDEKHFGPSSSRCGDSRSGIDLAGFDEFRNKRRDHPATDSHSARQVRARDGLILSNQVQDYPAVYVARRGSGRADEPLGIDASQLSGLGIAAWYSGA